MTLVPPRRRRPSTCTPPALEPVATSSPCRLDRDAATAEQETSMRRVRTITSATAFSVALIAAAAAAQADTRSDEGAAIVTFPYIVVDSASGRDTVVQLTNLQASAVDVFCIYVNANAHCGGLGGAVCTADADCP